MKLLIDRIEPNHWNPNEIRGEKRVQFKKDMEENGQREPITVSPYPVFYPGEADISDPEYKPYTTPEEWTGFFVICDGQNRYEIALELGWTELEANVEELTEDEALTKYYRQQSTRGDNNPLKEAGLFNYYLNQGLTQPEVVEKLNLSSVGYLNDRLDLLKLDPDVLLAFTDIKSVIESRVRFRSTHENEEDIENIVEDTFARAKLTMRHMRALSRLPEPQQKKKLDEILDIFIGGSSISVHHLEHDITEEKERLDRQKRFAEAHMKAVRKECSECGKPPVRYMNEEEGVVTCENAHPWRWNLTDEEEEELRAKEAAEREAQLLEEDYEFIEEIINGFEDEGDTLTLEDLQRTFYIESRHSNREESDQVVASYLEKNPDCKIPTLREIHKESITLLLEEQPETTISDILDHLYGAYRVFPNDGMELIKEYREEHPEVQLPEEPEPDLRTCEDEQPNEDASASFDEELNIALGIPPIPEAEPTTIQDPETPEPKVRRFITTEHSPEELREMMGEWGKNMVDNLDTVEAIMFKGVTKWGEKVFLSFNPNIDNGALRYTATKPDEEPKEFNISVRTFQHEGLTAVSGVNTALPAEELEAQNALISNFFEHNWSTRREPWDIPSITPECVKELLDIQLPDHGRDYEQKCIKCGESASDTRNIDQYGICDDYAGREYRENPDWCNMFRNADGSEPYCDHPELEEVGNCALCPVYQENEQAEENLRTCEDEDTGGTVLCASCGKQVPATQYCINCAELLLPAEDSEEQPEEDEPHELTENERTWLNSSIKELRALRDNLTRPETEYLLEHETRKGALGLLSKHMEQLSPPAEPIEAEDD